MKKFAKTLVCFLLLITLALSCVCIANAETTQAGFEPGVVLVGLLNDDTQIQDIAPELDVERVELADMDHDYIHYANTSKYAFLKVTLTKKTEQATLDAIKLLKTKEKVIVAEPFYTVYEKYNPGDVLLELVQGKTPAVLDEVLKGYEIESTRLLTPGSTKMNTYVITFSEKTKEIVAEVLPIIRTCKDVKIAEPNYIGEFAGVIPKGDADGDNKVTVLDATTIQQYLVGKIKASSFNYDEAIVTDNYCLTIIDATKIQQKLANIIEDF